MKFTELREAADGVLKPLKEKKVREKELLEELQPLISEYFVGETKLNNGNIVLKLCNGQSFRIIARENL